MSRIALAALLSSLSMSLCTAAAWAQAPEEPAVLLQRARDDLNAGNYQRALDALRRVFDATGNHAVLEDIATAHQRLGEPAEGARALRRYLDLEPAATDRAEVERRVAELDA